MATATNTEAEQQAIITILNAKKGYESLTGRLLGALTIDDFGTDAGNEVMAKILARVRAGRDIPRRNGMMLDSTFSDDAKMFLENIRFKPVTDEASVSNLIDTLKFHRKIRKILEAAREMSEACKKAGPEDINSIESKLDQLTMDVKGHENVSKILTFGAGDTSAADAVVQRITDKDDSKRIKTGFDYFDSRAGGAKRGHAFLIAGPAGGGKSALANQLLINMYMKGHHKTLFVSFEMDDEECVARMVSNVAGIDFAHVEQKRLELPEVSKMTKGVAEFNDIGKEHDCWFKVWPPDDNLTASNIISYCRPLAPDVLVVDYIGLLGQDNPKDDQWKSLGSAMRQFKMAAKKLNCLIIVLAQFDQDAMVVKYARALREHANIMWCWTYGKEEEDSGVVTIRQTAPYGKNRNCPPFDFRVKYELKLMRIHDFGEADPAQRAQAPLKKRSGGRQQDGIPVARTNARFDDE
jgi:replicative DNA helicase